MRALYFPSTPLALNFCAALLEPHRGCQLVWTEPWGDKEKRNLCPSKKPPGPLFPSTIHIKKTCNRKQKKKKKKEKPSCSVLQYMPKPSVRTHQWKGPSVCASTDKQLATVKLNWSKHQHKFRRRSANKDAQRAPKGLLQHCDRMSCYVLCSLCSLRGWRKNK